jgi:hypothetical protein
MQPLAVVKHLDIIHYILPDLIRRQNTPINQTFVLERTEKPFGHRIIQTIT